MYVNARAIVEHDVGGISMILRQVRNKPYEGGKRLELPGGRVEEFESLVSALKREVVEETGLEVTFIAGINTRLETGSADANVECNRSLCRLPDVERTCRIDGSLFSLQGGR